MVACMPSKAADLGGFQLLSASLITIANFCLLMDAIDKKDSFAIL